MRIAVLGANGQVGAEVCLLLHRVPGIEVVPVCRNRSGSAFLRAHGLRCRHGRAADPAEARALLGDCDVIANFALALGRPREAREANRRLIEASAAASPPGARIIFFSTLAVSPDFVPAGTPAMSTAYGKEKLRGERDALRAGRRTGKPTWVLRLGHVYGELQGIRAEMRRLIAPGVVTLPHRGEVGSNVTHTVTIVDAILKIAGGGEVPGTYDLVSHPVWSWREVLLQEAAAGGVDVQLVASSPGAGGVSGPGLVSRIASAGRRVMASLLNSPRTREIALTWIAYLPESVNLRLQSRHFRRRAVAEIARLNDHAIGNPAFSIPAVKVVELRTLANTADLLRQGAGVLPAMTGEFLPDLPPGASPSRPDA
jgi:nucleoside-diphosphate-sugar epimerase